VFVADWMLFPASMVAGVINAVAGGGSLLTFPLLMSLGYPPVVANVTNAVGVFPSSVGAAMSYRRELRDDPPSIMQVVSAVGATLIGCALLLNGDESTFEAIVPWLIFVAAAMIAVQPLLKRAIRPDVTGHSRVGVAVLFGVCVYGGYFGAAMGVMFLAGLGVVMKAPLQRINATKNALGMIVNGTCVVVFALFGPVEFLPVAIMAIGTLAGGFVGGKVARRLSENVFRVAAVLIGVVAGISLLLD
jgi:uncharacterized protein